MKREKKQNKLSEKLGVLEYEDKKLKQRKASPEYEGDEGFKELVKKHIM